MIFDTKGSGVDSGGAGVARAPPEFGGSEKGRSLISAYWSLAITASTFGFEKLSTSLAVRLAVAFSLLYTTKFFFVELHKI